MPNQKHWTADSPHARAPRKRNETVKLDEADSPPTTSGPCDGYEAGRLLRLYGLAAVDAICRRVAMEGGR